MLSNNEEMTPNVIKPTHPYAMPKSETFMPEMLKRYRYQRHMVGKWHLGYCDARYSPTFRGFYLCRFLHV